MKIKKAYHKIVDEKYDRDVDGVCDISHLSVSEIKVCVQFKSRPDDEPLPSRKKELLDRWELTKDRFHWDEEEFLVLCANTTEDIEAMVTDDLYAPIDDDSINNDGFDSLNINPFKTAEFV